MNYLKISLVIFAAVLKSAGYSEDNLASSLSVTGKAIYNVAPKISASLDTKSSNLIINVSFVYKGKAYDSALRRDMYNQLTNVHDNLLRHNLEPAEWRHIFGALPGPIALFDSNCNPIKSKNTNILTVYQNERYRSIFDKSPYITSKSDIKKHKNIISFSYNKRECEVCDLFLNQWYDIDYIKNYTFLIRPWLYKVDFLVGEEELIIFDPVKIYINKGTLSLNSDCNGPKSIEQTDKPYLTIKGNEKYGIAPTVNLFTNNNIVISVNYTQNDISSNLWLDVIGALPGAIALFDNNNNPIKSKSNKILSIYDNKNVCYPGEIIRNTPRIKPAYLEFNETNLIHSREINLNDWYDIKPNNEYKLVFKPMLYTVFPTLYDAYLVRFDNLTVHIPKSGK